MQTRTEMIHSLKQKREHVIHQISELEEVVDHLNGTITFLEKEARAESIEQIRPLEIEEFPIAKLRGLKQLEAVLVIAQYSHGLVKAQDAKRLMIKAGVMKETKNSTNITHNLIIRSKKFERVGPGEYRLKTESEPDRLMKEDKLTLNALFIPAKPLQ